ncbi:hypothetical protein NKH54_23375 [Mesorhizobium sp. M1004]
MTYQNKTFHAVATALDEPNDRLWVLCERSPDDDVRRDGRLADLHLGR